MSPILGISPFHRPDPGLVAALVRSGHQAALDLGHDLEKGLASLSRLARERPGPFGVRVHPDALPDPDDLPAAVEFVVLAPGVDPGPWHRFRTLAQATGIAEARSAVESGADEIVAVGLEAGGRVGEESTFVLLQRLLAELDVPVWAQGGIGPATAAACLAGGAAGVVLDSQLALTRESDLPSDVRKAVAAMDGTETTIVGGHRVFFRPDLEVVEEMRDASPEDVAGRLGGDDLRTRLLPIGQDGAFARGLADRHGSAARVVEAIRRGALDGMRAAREERPLAPGSPLAAEHGTRYPILQGPMTRVSDVPDFADAVSAAGGLPFLALSMMRGEPLRELLRDTAERLGDRPWGVGILGFVEADRRAEQLAAMEEVGPPFALIAGGRPSQARALESAGTPTYLHTPSPGLLELFLTEGARRFVFEGRECGGHVGPLSSFSLWQSQIDQLLEFEDLHEVSAVFAGGIHDARSAAMVSAMAAPLAARGAKVGVLMGTGYLFTREAVAAGAVLASYQRAALECDGTVLLETGPGHATRCVDSEYATAFRAERERMESQGVDPREMWIELERLNLGRLRIATKGLERRGDDLVAVDERARRDEGMYMIGQLAALRGEVVSMEELHRDVSEGAAAWLDALDVADVAVETVDEETSGSDVAIVGMACVFPDAPDLEAFWHNVVEGVDSIVEVPSERWREEDFFDPDGAPGLTTPSKWGGFLDPIPFDPARYGIPPKSIPSIDPIQLLSLEVARRALEDAGYEERGFDRDRTAVVFGTDGGSDLPSALGFRAQYRRFIGEMPAEIDDHLPPVTEDTFPGMLANVIAGRIANRLDLGGENCTVSAACASSLAALATACRWLEAGDCDMVIAGGADVHNAAGDFLMFSSVHALSRRGQCRTFDEDADGIVLGEGVGAVILKRLSDARRDGDRVYAVVKGVGASSDGRSMGLTAPRREGQVRALERAYEATGVHPPEIGLMEAHGTGTVVGDRTELQSMTEVFTASGAAPGSVALGSVKSQIGHTKNAAGMAALVKVALSLHHRVLPPTLHVEKPNPFYDPDSSPFVFDDRARPWTAERRLAGISSFGFGGTNYHAILEEDRSGEPPVSGLPHWPAELFLFRGVDPEAALERVGRLARLLESSHPGRLRDLARSVSTGGDGPVQIAFVARDLDDLRERVGLLGDDLTASDIFLRDPARADGPLGKTAFLFPGQGSQYPGMLAEIFLAFPDLRRLLDLAPEVVERMYPPQSFTPEERARRERELTRTDVAQVALGIVDLAVGRVLERLGIDVHMAAGHSYGEIVALSMAGAWDEGEVVRLSAERARAILESVGEDPGTMVAVAAGVPDLAGLLADHPDVVAANCNSPRQTILSGPTDAMERAVEALREAQIASTPIKTACAFHSPVVSEARDRFREILAETATGKLEIPVWANATAAPYPADDPAAIRDLFADQIVRSVRFVEQIEAMYDDGARVFVEVGPGRVLTGLVGRILGDRPHLAVPTDVRGESPLVRIQQALASMAVAGVEFDVEALYTGRGARRFDLEADPPTQSKTAWRVDGHRAWPAHQPPPAAPDRVLLRPAGETAEDSGGRSSDATVEDAVLAYLDNVREMVESQRDVMLEFLGSEAPERRPRQARRALRSADEIAPATPDVATPPPQEPHRNGAPGSGESGSIESLDPLEVLTAIVSERTGYPAEMLDPDLDLEADLSIDSIKRIEILGILNDRISLAGGLGGDRDAILEELALVRTLRGMAEFIEERAQGAAPEPAEPAGESVTESHRDPYAGDEPSPLDRRVFRVRAIPTPDPTESVAGKRLLLTDDGRGVASELAGLLRADGAEVTIGNAEDLSEGFDGVVHLAPLAPNSGPQDVKTLFDLARALVHNEGRLLIGVTGIGGAFGYDANGAGRPGQGGVAGLLKSLAKEWPEGRVRAVDVDPHESPATVAGWVFSEIVADGDRVQVGWRGGARHELELVEEDLPDPGGTSPASPLDADAVVLVTGGARGITAHVSIELARRFGCALELVGRTPVPSSGEPAEVAGLDDPRDLKRRLMEDDPNASLPEIESRARAILAEREVRSTLEAIEAAGGRARYHALDVRDEAALGRLVDEIYERHGRLDGVIHAAGTIEDKLLVHKTRDSFSRVFDTKVVPALTLADRLRGDTRFLVFFSSLAGVIGNAGQTDYAAANDVLDTLALHLNSNGTTRVLSVDWGPWDAIGMVGEELRREYARRGIGLIPIDVGVRGLVDEIVRGSSASARVVLMSPSDAGVLA